MTFFEPRLRVRKDLVVVEQDEMDRKRWAVKDPIALEYFHLGADEYFLFSSLDGNTTLEEVKEAYDQEHYPSRISMREIESFCVHLHAHGLLVSDGQGQDDVLLRRARKTWFSGVTGFMLSPLSIRLPGLNPTGFLSLIAPIGVFLFHPLIVLASLLFAMAAAALVVSQADHVIAKLPTTTEALTGYAILWFVLAVSVAKSLHELGHALACHHYGGECSEVGIMFLAFAPCLYTDVSDSWMFKQTRQRVAVGCAGMYFEMLVATGCVFLWYFSQPGLLHTIALNLVIVCSIGTFVFNANPLMHYDGYFLLSDIWKVPNLSQQSRWVLQDFLSSWVFREHRQPRRYSGSPIWLGCYGFSAMVYRLIMISLILFFTYKLLKSYQLSALGDVLVIVTLMGMAVQPIRSAWRFFKRPGRTGRVHWLRFCLLMLFSCILGYQITCWPVSRCVNAPFTVELKDAHVVRALTSGELTDSIEEGARVIAGQSVAQLADPQKHRHLVQVEGEVEQLRHQLESCRKRGNDDTSLLSQLPTLRAAIEEREEELRHVEEEIARLDIQSPGDGVVLPPPVRPREPEDVDLPLWSGTPLQPQNHLCQIQRGDVICLVGEPNSIQATLVVNQDQIGWIKVGTPVRLWMDEVPDRSIQGTIRAISQGSMVEVPNALALDHQLSTHLDENGKLRPTNTSYLVRVDFQATQYRISHGSQGRAQVDTGSITVGQVCQRFLSRTFRFNL